MSASDRILELLRAAGADPDTLRLASNILAKWRAGLITSEEAYYAIMGLARERFVPLTPRQVGELRTLLGLPRG